MLIPYLWAEAFVRESPTGKTLRMTSKFSIIVNMEVHGSFNDYEDGVEDEHVERTLEDIG